MKLQEIIKSSENQDLSWGLIPCGPIYFLTCNGSIVDGAQSLFTDYKRVLFDEIQRKSHSEDLFCRYDDERFLFWKVAQNKKEGMILYVMMDVKKDNTYYLIESSNFWLVNQKRMQEWMFN